MIQRVAVTSWQTDRVPSTHDIATFSDDEPPEGESPWVVAPVVEPIEIVEPDPSWPDAFETIASRVRSALGARALLVEHVGSTSVPGLPAKPVIDVDLIVASSHVEAAWAPALESVGFVLTVREPWWHEHRMMKLAAPRAHLHVFSPDAPEPWKHRIFRDHLTRDADDRARYARVKREAASHATHGAETMMEYNARKQAIIREIYERAFRAAGVAP